LDLIGLLNITSNDRLSLTMECIFGWHKEKFLARMGQRKVAYRVLVGTPEEKRPLGKPRH
jgi:hypothetical protein